MRPSRWFIAACVFASLTTPASSPPAEHAEAPSLELPAIVFVSRNPVVNEEGEPCPGAIPGIGPRDRTAAVGGRLLVRDSDGRVRVLAGPPAFFDVADPCVSWDGSRVLFSGLQHRDSSWRIFAIDERGERLEQITRSDRDIPLDQFGPAARRLARYDDFDPCWLPDGRVCFASTRYPTIAEDGRYLASNLFVTSAGGGKPYRITTDRNGSEEPAIDPRTGRVVFARWMLNLDRPSNVAPEGITYLDHEALTEDVGNLWQTLSIAPDGRGPQLHAGDPRSRPGMVCYKPSLLPDGRVLTLFGLNPAFAPSPAGTGIRIFAPGADPGRYVIGLSPEAPDPLAALADPPLPAMPSAADPCPLPGDKILISYAPPGAGDYGLYRCGLDGSGLELVLDYPGTHELDACVLGPSPIPPVIKDQVDTQTAELPPTEDPRTFISGGSFRFDCLNVYTNAPVDAPIPDAPIVTPNARFRLFLNFQRQNPHGRDPSILFCDSPLTITGAVMEQGVPADVPFFGQLVDSRGRLLEGPDGIPAHVVEFASGRHQGWAQCVGCHVGHSVIEIPNNYASAQWFNISTSARVEASSVWTPAGNSAPPASARRVVDRRARRQSLEVAWLAAGRRGEHVTLRWDFPIEVNRIVLYGVQPDPQNDTDLRVEDCRITMLLAGAEVRRIPHTGRIDPDGTEIRVPETKTDAVRIEILKTRGRVHGHAVTGLAEVETIARLSPR